MEILAILFLIGCWYVARDTVRSTGRKMGAARQAARQSASARGGRASTAHVTRRAARQATAGWWAGELRHGMPTVRHNLAAGWADHQLARTEAEHRRRQLEAAHAGRMAQLRQEIEYYLLAMEAISMLHQRQRDAQECTCSIPPDGDPEHASVINRNCPQHGLAGPMTEPPPPPDLGKRIRDLVEQLQRERQQQGQADEDPADTRDDLPPVAAEQEPAPATAGPEANGKDGGQMPTGTSGSGDFNYDSAVALADKLAAVADTRDPALDEAMPLADALGGMVPDDRDVNGQAADVVSAAGKVNDGFKELAEAAAALKETLTRKYGPVQEAKDASGEELPEKQFMEH